MSDELRRAVFLDRDGVLVEARVLNGMPYSPRSAEEMEIAPGTRDALAQLKQQGFLLVVVTNQPEMARGTLETAALDQMHQRLRCELPLDEILVCPHDDRDECACRKPKPGLLLEAARRHGIDLGRSFFVGDRWRDVDAGHAAGCTTVLIDHGYAERPPAAPPHARVRSLAEAVRWIVEQAGKGV